MNLIDQVKYGGSEIYVYDANTELHFKVFKDGHIRSDCNHPVTKAEGEYDRTYYSEAFRLMFRCIRATLPKFFVRYELRTHDSVFPNYYQYWSETKLPDNTVKQQIESFFKVKYPNARFTVSILENKEVRPGYFEPPTPAPIFLKWEGPTEQGDWSRLYQIGNLGRIVVIYDYPPIGASDDIEVALRVSFENDAVKKWFDDKYR